MLMPSTWGASRTRSPRCQQLSSATRGIGQTGASAAKPAVSRSRSSWGARGCSSSTTPWAARGSSMALAVSKLQPPLASTCNSMALPRAWRRCSIAWATAASKARSWSGPSGLPSLSLMRLAGSCCHQRSSRANTAGIGPKPRVTLVATQAPGSSPQSCHNGRPSRRPHQSCSARSRPQRAGGLRGASRGSRACSGWGAKPVRAGTTASSSAAICSVP